MTKKFFFRYHKYDQIVWKDPIQRDKLIRDLKKWLPHHLGTNTQSESEAKRKAEDMRLKEEVERKAAEEAKLKAEKAQKEELLLRILDGLGNRSIVGSDEKSEKEPPVLLHPVINADGLWGYQDDSGKMVIKPRWKDADYFSEGLASVTADYDLYGYIDETGAMIIKPQWIEANPFSEGLAAVKILKTADNGFEYDQYGYIDHTGKYVIPSNWNEAGDFYEGYACVKRGELYGGRGGFIDKTGRLAIPALNNWKDWKDVSEGMMRVCDERNRWGFFNTKGEQVIPFKWKNARAFSEGLAAVQNDKDEWCFIDKKGNVKIPTNSQWKEVGHFRCGLARVMKSTCRYDEEWGYINTKGELVIDFQWLEAMDFDQGVARVKTTILWRLINTKGEFVDSLPD